MSYIKLSYILLGDSPIHVALKKPEIIHINDLSQGDGYNSFILTFENHSGTHVDAPGHFMEDSKIISDYGPEELIFNNPLIFDIPKDENELIELSDIYDKDFSDVDCLFFRTGFENFRETRPEKYLTKNPGISPS